MDWQLSPMSQNDYNESEYIFITAVSIISSIYYPMNGVHGISVREAATDRDFVLLSDWTDDEDYGPPRPAQWNKELENLYRAASAAASEKKDDEVLAATLDIVTSI